MKLKFNYEQAKDLLNLFGEEDADITVQESDGKLYAYFTEMPEEGSIILGDPEEEHEPIKSGRE
jgi:hypothetical protein